MSLTTLTTMRPPIDSRRIRRQRSAILRAGCRRGLARVRRACAEAFRCREPMKPSQWIGERMRLDNTVEAGSGRYDLARRPWWVTILDAFYDPEVAEEAIAAATQVGKTLAMIAGILWAAENAPAPGMLVTPDRDTAVELRDRIYLNALATIRAGHCTHLRVPPEHQWNTRYIDLGSMRVYLAWSGSRQRLRGRPCRYVWMTEVAVYSRGMKKAGDPVAAAKQRVKAFFRHFIWAESSPSDHPCRITELEQQATARYRWKVCCPKCKAKFELRFFPHKSGEQAGRDGIVGVRDAGGELLSAETARREAHYVCPRGCKIENAQKQELLESGRMEVVSHDGRKGKPVCRRSLGFHLWSVHSEAISFGDLAAAYVEHMRQMKLAEFFGNWLGLEYKPPTRVPAWRELGKQHAAYNARGQVPAEAWFLTGHCDVQGENNGVRVSVRGWAPGRTSWLVDWRWLEREPGDDNLVVCSDLAKVTREVLERRYPVINRDGRPAKNPLGKRELAVKLLGVDVGHLPRKVHAWLQSLPESWTLDDGTNVPRVRAIRGDHQLSPDTRWQRAQWEQNVRTGEAYEDGGLTVWRLNVYTYYDVLTQLLCAEPHKPGGWHVTADALTLGQSYLEQVVNFAKQVKIDPDTGLKKTVWAPRHARVAVDYWDTSVGELVCAEMVLGDLGWDAERWQAWLKDSRQAASDAQGGEGKRGKGSGGELAAFDDR